MIFKKKETDKRRKLYYTLKVTEQEYVNLRHFLKENRIPYKKRFRLRYNPGMNTIVALSLAVLLIVLVMIFIKFIK